MWLFTSRSFISIIVDLDDKTKRLVRASIPVEEVAQKIQECVTRMDYGNFKDSVPSDHKDRQNAYMEVWGVMQKYQK